MVRIGKPKWHNWMYKGKFIMRKYQNINQKHLYATNTLIFDCNVEVNQQNMLNWLESVRLTSTKCSLNHQLEIPEIPEIFRKVNLLDLKHCKVWRIIISVIATPYLLPLHHDCQIYIQFCKNCFFSTNSISPCLQLFTQTIKEAKCVKDKYMWATEI